MTRKEAINKIRQMSLPKETMEILQALAPELTESEDERIRKELIKFFSSQIVKVIRGIPIKDILAYLEKQKEQKPAERSLEDDHIIGFVYDLLKDLEWKDDYAMSKEECLRRLGEYRPQKPAEKLSKEEYVKKFKALCDAYEIKLPNREYDIYGLCKDLHKLFGDIQKPVEWGEDIIRKAVKEVGLTQHQIDWFKVNVFPPKQEWSEEDETHRAFILESLEDQIRFQKKDAEGAYYTKQIRAAQDWLKNRFKSIRPQPKQEWSEEDERMLRRCIKSIESSKNFADSQTFKEAKDKEKEWLKSLPERLNLQPKQEWSEEEIDKVVVYLHERDGGMLWSKAKEIASDICDILRPHPNWKPKKEQIEALKNAAFGAVVNGDGPYLRQLYNELKKL